VATYISVGLMMGLLTMTTKTPFLPQWTPTAQSPREHDYKRNMQPFICRCQQNETHLGFHVKYLTL